MGMLYISHEYQFHHWDGYMYVPSQSSLVLYINL